MSGNVDEICYSVLKERTVSSQSELGDFSNDKPTYIAVVSMPRGGIEDIVDEVARDLGMPQRALKEFLATRSGYRSNSAIDDAHNQAYEDVGLAETYRDHLTSDDVIDTVDEVVERVIDGEDITFVCYEKDGDSCHRHLLVDVVRELVDRRTSSPYSENVSSSGTN